MFSSFMNPQRGYEDAERQARRGYEEAQRYQMPYYQHGLDAYGGLNDAYKKLLNPAALQDEWSKAYTASPESLRQQDMFRNQGMEEASRMGLMGSSAGLSNIQQGTADISMADRRNYMNDLMQKYMTGIGLGQNIYGTGAQAGSQMGDRAFNQAGRMAELGYGRKNSPGNTFGNLLGMGAGLAATYFTGGLGGVAAGALAKKIGQGNQ